MRIIFIGPPGAGKGTQCMRLAQHLKIPHFSTGEMLRATRNQSALGRVVASYIDGGRLAPDYLVMRLVKKRLAMPDCVGGCLFDGFPRTVDQARMLDEYLVEKNGKIDLVLNLVADQEELIGRLLKRSTLEDRVDENAETISARLRVFHTQTAPVLDYYAGRDLMRTVNAMQSPDQVFEAILEHLP
ncbi:MAG: adenylate kinase [Rubripirellula sp.]